MQTPARLKISRYDRIRKKLRAFWNFPLWTRMKNPYPTTVKDTVYELLFLSLIGCLIAEAVLFVKFFSET